jgi:hypothetical protein
VTGERLKVAQPAGRLVIFHAQFLIAGRDEKPVKQ